MTTANFDIAVLGGGIMGASTAYNLIKADPKLKIAIIEKDPSYQFASTALSMTNARIQFSLKQNVEISKYAFEVLDNFEEEMEVDGRKPRIDLRHEGNLFMVTPEIKTHALEAFNMQKELGCSVEWWGLDKVREVYPLYEPDREEYEAATFGGKDGHFDAFSVLMGYKNKAVSMGVHYMQGEVAEIKKEGGKATGVLLTSGDTVNAGVFINCTGAWAKKVLATAGIDIPVDPVKRQVFAFNPETKPQGPLPLTILSSGLYFRTETGGLILVGKSLPEDPVGFEFTADEDRFMDELWPEIATFVPAFEALKLVRGWAGLYAVNTLDGNAILGEWPEMKGLYLANGFSGHGLQQAPAVGRYLTELILGKPHALDLSIFNPERILKKQPLSESGLV